MSGCPNCNKPIPVGAAFCPTCGKPIAKSPARQQDQATSQGSAWSLFFPPLLAEQKERNVFGLISVAPLVFLLFVAPFLASFTANFTANYDRASYNAQHWIEGILLFIYWFVMWTKLQTSVVANVINTLVAIFVFVVTVSVPGLILYDRGGTMPITPNRGWSIAIVAVWVIFAVIGAFEAKAHRSK